MHNTRGGGFNLKVFDTRRYFCRTWRHVALGEGIGNAKSLREKRACCVSGTRRVPCGCSGGTWGENGRELGPRENRSQSGQGSAGPCKDRECFSERWRPLTRAVTCSDLHFKSSPCGVVDWKRLQRKQGGRLWGSCSKLYSDDGSNPAGR